MPPRVSAELVEGAAKAVVELAESAAGAGAKLLESATRRAATTAKTLEAGGRDIGARRNASPMNDVIREKLGLTPRRAIDDERATIAEKQIARTIERSKKANELPLSAGRASKFEAAEADESGVARSGYIRAMRDMTAPPTSRALTGNVETAEAVPYFLKPEAGATPMKLDAKAKLAALVKASDAEPIASPAIVKRLEGPFDPTASFRSANENMRTRTENGVVHIDYKDGALGFKFRGQLGSYGGEVYTAALHPDGRVVLGNEESILKIGAGNPKTPNTLGLEEGSLAFGSMPKQFQREFPQMEENKIATWFRGDDTWLRGQANAPGKGFIRPTQAEFDPKGKLISLKFDSPITMTRGPFEGIKGDAVGYRADGVAILVNSERTIGGVPKSYQFFPATRSIRTNTLTGTNDLTPVQWLKPNELDRVKGY